MPDAHKNFAASLVATAPSPASSGTSLVVTASEGAIFPDVPFNATIWPANSQPTTVNAEIVRVTNISTDTLTITRTQEGTSARTVIVGDQIAATVTALTLTDVEDGLPASLVTAKADLIVGTAAGAVDILPGPGGTGRVLASNTGETTGLIWTSDIRGFDDAGGFGADLEFDDASPAGAGGPINARGGDGAAGQGGGNSTFRGGDGNDGDTEGAELIAQGGDGTTENGKLRVKTDGTFGSGSAILGSDDDGNVIWRGSTQVLARPSGDAGDLWDVLNAYGLVTAP